MQNTIFAGPHQRPVFTMLYESDLIQFAMRHFREPDEREFLQQVVDDYKGNFSEVFFQVFYAGLANLTRLRHIANTEGMKDPFEPYVAKLYGNKVLITASEPLLKSYNEIEMVPGVLETTISPRIINDIMERYHQDAIARLERYYLRLELVVRDMYIALGLNKTPVDTTLINLLLMVDGVWTCQLDYDSPQMTAIY